MLCPQTMSISTTSHVGDILLGSNCQKPAGDSVSAMSWHRTLSRAGGDRTHDRGIMRWLQTVGMVRWCRIHPDLKENLSGGVGLVRGICRGIFSMGSACGFTSETRSNSSTTQHWRIDNANYSRS